MARYRSKYRNVPQQYSSRGQSSRRIILGLTAGGILFVSIKLFSIFTKINELKEQINHDQNPVPAYSIPVDTTATPAPVKDSIIGE